VEFTTAYVTGVSVKFRLHEHLKRTSPYPPAFDVINLYYSNLMQTSKQRFKLIEVFCNKASDNRFAWSANIQAVRKT